MKKIFSMMAACALAMGFTACESIPSPYEIFDEIIDGIATDIYYESAACYTGWNLELGAEQTIQYNPWSQGSSYTQATGYQKWDGSDTKSNKEAEGFLVSPKFKTTAKDNNVVFSFDYCIGYANNDKDFAKHTKIYVSKTYNDGAIDLNDWEEINWTATHTSTDWTLANTGNIGLPAEYMNQDNVHIAFWFYAPAAGSATFEIKNFVIETGVAGEQPEKPGEGVSGEPAGDGSQANPFNVAATIDFVNKLQKNAKSDPVYIKGIVKKFKAGEEPGNQYGNATFYIVDSEDAAEDFYCYRVMGPGNKNFTSADQLKVGDEVVIYGPLTLYSSDYGDTPETVQKECYVYSINGKVEEGGNTDTPTPGGEAKGSGTAADPFNVAGILAFGKEGNYSNDNLSKEVYVKGIVSNVASFTEKYGNINYYISEDGKTGGEEFYVYGGLGLNGEKFTSINELHVGAEVVVAGQVTIYNGTVEFTHSSKIITISNNEGGNVTPGGGEDTPVIDEDKNGDFESWSGSTPLNWTTSSTAGNATLKQSTDAHSGKYSVEVGGTASGNKRLGRKEMTLEAGTYTMTFWVKAASSAGGSVRPGFVPVTNGAVGSYVYGDYTNDLGTDWVQVTHTFDIPTTGIYSIVIMNSKNPGANVLIDDFVLMKGDAKVISSRRRARK
ncbi:MAG: carbohydrate binding domain-containing protein [Bacteroidales bacterium]|nr:carbohydrate binding domain-containing protein [Bacteroidales bacterium]